MFDSIAGALPTIAGVAPKTLRDSIATLVAFALAFVLWRLGYAAADRFFQRRFAARHIPRVVTFLHMTRSVVGFVVLVALILVLLNIWDVNVTPALWSAGIVTAALAFGAQTLVRDVLAGFSILLEDQYDIGDSVELTTTVNSVIVGTVEAIGLRTTRILDERGRHIYIPNGQILYSSNASRTPNRATLEFVLPLAAPVGEMRERVESLVKDAAKSAGVPVDDAAVTVKDASAGSVTLATNFRLPRDGSASRLSAVRQHVTSELQTMGWLPGGRPTN